MILSINRLRDSLAITVQRCFIAVFRELLDRGERVILCVGKPALDMEQIGGVLLHKDCVMRQTASQFVARLSLFGFGGFGIKPFFYSCASRISI